MWERAADAVGLPRFTLMGVVGGLAARGERHSEVWEVLGVEPPDLTWSPHAFYADALPCLSRLRSRGFLVGAVGNTAAEAEEMLREHVDVVGSSTRWGVEKPAPEFFNRMVVEAECDPGRLAYVGDRVDNDVVPALAAGMVAVHLRRGPWGRLQLAPPRRPRDRVAHGVARRVSLAPVTGSSSAELRVGIGVDAHALVEDVPLVLGGVAIDYPRGLAGHSDGDVVSHALIDALLGAANLGDIGSVFPSDDVEYEGASSLDLLWEAYREVRDGGWELVNADCVLVGEEPRIAPVREEMCERLAGALGVESGRITVRATTTDRLGFTGRGEGLAAYAVALLQR